MGRRCLAAKERTVTVYVKDEIDLYQLRSLLDDFEAVLDKNNLPYKISSGNEKRTNLSDNATK